MRAFKDEKMYLQNELNEKEKRLFRYLCDNINENGYSPSIRDICAALGIKSTSTVHMYLDKLEKKGYISKKSGKGRTIKIECEDEKKSGKIPIVGRVTAGVPILAVENREGYIEYLSGLFPRSENELFALRVSGRSMIEAGILDGDIVIVEKTPVAENGEIIVAMIEEEATVKTFYKENGHFRLQPENHTMKPIITDELVILGKVVANIRFYK